MECEYGVVMQVCEVVWSEYRVIAPIAGELHLVLHYKLCPAYYVGAILLCIWNYEICGMNHDPECKFVI